MNNNRLYQFDLCRVICVIWIVGFWHLQYYLSESYRLQGVVYEYCKIITNCILACFTFLSGFFLSKYTFSSKSDISMFYKKRLFRFFPLLLASVLSLVCIGGGHVSQIIPTMFGYSLFMSRPIQTLWYFSMLILFYFLTPILKFTISNSTKTAWGIIFIFLFVAISLKYADVRLLMYFPFYVIGLNIEKDSFLKIIKRKFCFVWLLLFFISLVCAYNGMYVCMYVCMYSGFLCLLSLSMSLYHPMIERTITVLAYASMCAYLFHRQLYGIIVFCIRYFSSIDYMPLLVAICSVCVLFGISWFVQFQYDKLVKKYVNGY